MYLKYFGLREAPFNLTPDPKFFYDSPLHREAWASLLYGITEKKGFVVVTGEVGTGKTTLIRKLLRNLEATHRSVFIFNTLLSFDELLEAILRDLDIEAASSRRVAMLEQLNEFLLDQLKQGHIVSLMLDEAQNLSEEALEAVRLLSNMETDREKLLQIILVGQPELDVKLNRRSLRALKQRVSLYCRLGRLSQSDTEAYIHHRLAVAGYEGPDIFSKACIQIIWEHTSGTPRLINAVCDNALVTAFAISKKTVSPDIVQEVVRDLRLGLETPAVDFVAPGQNDLEQTSKRISGSVTEIGNNKIGSRGPRAEEQDGSRFSRNGPAATNNVEAIYNFGFKREPATADFPVPDGREIKRQQARSGAAVAELKERIIQDQGRMVDVEENPWAPHASGGAEVSAGYSSNARNRADDGIASQAFLDKMATALTEAMGPMARLVIKGQVAALGESLERFPVVRLHDLIKGVGSEILSEVLRAAFENQISKERN